MLDPQQTINCRGKLLDLSRPKVMGILNVTPDSFFDGGRYEVPEAALRQAERMIGEGAAILDIGGMSTRPGAALIDPEEEWRRVGPVIDLIRRHFPEALLSVDTVHSRVARLAVEHGAHLVNDVSAGRLDPAMYETVAALGVPYVLMHMQGTPATMQQEPVYEDVAREVLDFFIAEVGRLRDLGVNDIILDPGFGFGKTLLQNYRLLRQMHTLQILDLPLLAGLSRKSMIWRLLDISPGEALNGTSALHLAALQQGSRILRVHDVAAARQVIRLWQALEGEDTDRDNGKNDHH